MKFILFFAAKRGYTTLKSLIETKRDSIGVVVTFKEVDVSVSYHDSIEKICYQNDIPFFYWNQAKNNLPALLEEHKVSGAIAISWKYLLDLKYFDKLEYKLIVFHDSLLPKYRGFAPTPTAVICGENVIGVTAMFACNETDAGDIILQKSMEIGMDEYIDAIIDRQADLYCLMAQEIFENINVMALNARKQNQNNATYSVWRSPEDCRIDWKNKSLFIYNLIRAVGKPYTGAYTYMDNKKIVINKAEIVPEMEFALRNPGKIWSIENGCPVVICGYGMLKINEAIYEDGTIAEFKRVRTLFV